MNTKLFLIFSLFYLTSGITIVTNRKRSFLKTSLKPKEVFDDKKGEDILGSGKPYNFVFELAKKYKDKVGEVSFVGVSEAHVGKIPNNFVVCDAGGSGTRFYVGLKDEKTVVQVKFNIKSASIKTEDIKQLTEIAKEFREATKGKMIALATAGRRIGDQKQMGKMADIFCGGAKDCVARTMPGHIEGALGFIDGHYSVGSKYNVAETNCYIEYGSTSSQVAFKNGDSIWALSGVRSGLSPDDGSHKMTECDSSSSGEVDPGKCGTAVTSSKIFDSKLKECLVTGKKLGAKCDRLAVRVNFNVAGRAVAGLKGDGKGCGTKSTDRDGNFNCVATLGMREIIKGLGVEKLIDDKTIVTLADKDEKEEVEWAWGLIRHLNKNGFKIETFAGDEQGSEGDCGEIKLSY